jgi:hypothetical protein
MRTFTRVMAAVTSAVFLLQVSMGPADAQEPDPDHPGTDYITTTTTVPAEIGTAFYCERETVSGWVLCYEDGVLIEEDDPRWNCETMGNLVCPVRTSLPVTGGDTQALIGLVLLAVSLFTLGVVLEKLARQQDDSSDEDKPYLG